MRRLFVLTHSRGPAWDQALTFFEQPGIGDHIAFMHLLTADGWMVLGGPFDDGDASGAMAMSVIIAGDAEEATRLAGEDGSVQAGVLRVEVRPWNVAMGLGLGSLPAQEGG